MKSILARKCKRSKDLEVVVGDFAVLCEKPQDGSMSQDQLGKKIQDLPINNEQKWVWIERFVWILFLKY